MNWYDIVIESLMSPEEALSILGIDSFSSKEELDKIYKQLAMKNHPDRGGNPEKMKQINIAKDVLSKFSSYNKFGGTAKKFINEISSDTEQKERWEIARKFTYDYLNKINIKNYVDYLNEIFKENFSVSKEIKQHKAFYSSYVTEVSSYVTEVYLYVEFANETRDKVIDLHFDVDIYSVYRALFGKKKVISMNDASFYVTMKSNLFLDGKKQVLQKEWSKQANNINWSEIPSVLMPKARLIKLASGKVREKSKVAKRDFEALFLTKYKGTQPYNDKGYYAISNDKKDDTMMIIIRRIAMTFSNRNKLVTYDIVDIVKPVYYTFSNGDTAISNYKSILQGNLVTRLMNTPSLNETKESLQLIDNIIKRFRNTDNITSFLSETIKEINTFVEANKE